VVVAEEDGLHVGCCRGPDQAPCRQGRTGHRHVGGAAVRVDRFRGFGG
jgi:hypothetical protein